MFHSFRLSPPTPNNNAIAGPGPQTTQHRQRDHLDDEPRLGDGPFTSSGVHHAPLFPPHPVTENALPGLGFQPYKHQPLSPSFMNSLYSFDVENKPLEPPNADKDNFRGADS